MNLYVSFFFGIAFAIVCAFVAKKKSRDPFLWGIAGLFFAVFALIILLILPPLKPNSAEDQEKITTDLKEMQELENTEKLKDEPQNNTSNKLWYYLDEKDQQYGPMSSDALMSKWKEGEIKAETFVWNEELTDWKPLQETSDFQLLKTNKKFN